MPKRSANTKMKLLDAADHIVLSQSASRLTLDAVAQEAEVSKGGLLYHYPNKDALISGMIARLIKSFESALIQQADQDDDRAAWLRAYAQITLDPQLSQAETSAGILAAVAANPSLLDPLRERYRAWQEQIESGGIDPSLATVIRLAADGLWFAELMGLSPLSDERRQQVLKTLEELIDYGISD